MSNEKMYFETAPVDELCSCVALPVTKDEEKLLQAAKHRSKNNYRATWHKLASSGKEISYDAECENCDCGILISVASSYV